MSTSAQQFIAPDHPAMTGDEVVRVNCDGAFFQIVERGDLELHLDTRLGCEDLAQHVQRMAVEEFVHVAVAANTDVELEIVVGAVPVLGTEDSTFAASVSAAEKHSLKL